jgi:hypothetical protein
MPIRADWRDRINQFHLIRAVNLIRQPSTQGGSSVQVLAHEHARWRWQWLRLQPNQIVRVPPLGVRFMYCRPSRNGMAVSTRVGSEEDPAGHDGWTFRESVGAIQAAYVGPSPDWTGIPEEITPTKCPVASSTALPLIAPRDAQRQRLFAGARSHPT